jgi:hypothetical protein
MSAVFRLFTHVIATISITMFDTKGEIPNWGHFHVCEILNLSTFLTWFIIQLTATQDTQHT